MNWISVQRIPSAIASASTIPSANVTETFTSTPRQVSVTSPGFSASQSAIGRQSQRRKKQQQANHDASAASLAPQQAAR